jgi:hypothetical protein
MRAEKFSQIGSQRVAMKLYVSITELSDGGEIVGGGVQKTVESIGRIQFRSQTKTRRLRRNFSKEKLAGIIS